MKAKSVKNEWSDFFSFHFKNKHFLLYFFSQSFEIEKGKISALKGEPANNKINTSKYTVSNHFFLQEI